MKNRWVYLTLALLLSITAGFFLAEITSFPGGGTGGQTDSSQVVPKDSVDPEQKDPGVDPEPESNDNQEPESPSSDALPQGTYSWWYSRQPNHQPSRVDPVYQKLLAGKGIYLGDTAKKRIYLTLDEGYENGYTSSILDTLKKHQVAVIFFVTGSYVEKNPELVKRMVSEGHLVGNHSQTHPSFPKLSEEAMRQEIQTVNQQVRQLTGQQPRYFRPPNGAFDSRTLKVANELGCRAVFWSLAYRDWEVNNQPGREAAYRQVIDNVHNGAVILLHAVSQSNSEALDEILTELERQGYTFGSLDDIAS